MIFNDNQLHYLCTQLNPPMISPFQPEQIRRTESGAAAISSGLSSFGYDIRLADAGLKHFRNPRVHFTIDPQTGAVQDKPPIVVDPKNFDSRIPIHLSVNNDDSGSFYILSPGAYALGVSVEAFDIPRHVLGICYCKSTYARCGLMVNTTPLEPGWRGQLVIELANLTDLPMKVYANEGIAQVVFFEGDIPSVTYADRSGKYQDQKGIVTARI